MEIINDISKRHVNVQKDINKKTNEIIGLFKNPTQRNVTITLKKFEKIVAALYLVTDVMPADLPLTQTIRSQTLDALSYGYTLATHHRAISRENLTTWFMHIDHIIGLVRIGTIAHHISEMNADILLGELEKITQVLISEIGVLNIQEQQISKFGLPTYQPLIKESITRDDVFAGLVKDTELKRHQNDIKTTLFNQNDIIKDTLQNKTTQQNDIENQKDTFKNTIKNKSPLKSTPQDILNRKQKILDIIRSKGVATIHDIKRSLPEINDKTLQREMNNLIQLQVISKQGNKRWTTYEVV
jgi:hypothetical protein